MSHHSYTQPSTPSMEASSRSWGTASSTAHPGYASPALTTSSWGSVHSKTSLVYPSNVSTYSFGIPSHLSWSPDSSRDSQTVQGTPPPGVWPGPMPASPPYGGSASSTSLISAHGHGVGVPAPGLAVRLHPILEAGRLWIDLAYPPSMNPSAVNYHPSMTDTAFNPSMSYMQVQFYENPKWSLRIHNPQGVTVFIILNHIFNYLQLPDSQDVQATRAVNDFRLDHMADHRHQNASSASFNAGQKRIDMLSRRRLFAGLSPIPGGHNSWVVRLTEPSR
ncbi:hypothetical protein BDZ97DRAFT_349477 [Flammula alnicola]|nr:hypothetical protein BDZ97DRAFT_349477 [Flammula alnicola]